MFEWNETIQKIYDEREKAIQKHKELKQYKPFRKQFLECNENGNLIHIDTEKMKHLYGHDVGVILVCVKHEAICGSDVCKEERIKW